MPGLNSILGLLSAAETVERNLNEGFYIRKALEQNQQKIVEANVEQLYEYGINSLGIRIDTYQPYTPYTVRIKQEKGQPYDRVTLRDTGDFQKSFEVVFEPIGFYITATDYKTQDLIDKYGAKIFGLIKENRQEIAIKYVFPVVTEEIKREMFG